MTDENQITVTLKESVELLYKFTQTPHIIEQMKKDFIEELLVKSYIQGGLNVINAIKNDDEIDYKNLEITLEKLISELQKINT